jgi:hypothetical protein
MDNIRWEYRMIDHDMFDEDMPCEINRMGERGWEIFRILDPIPWVNNDGMFIRIFYKRVL